MALGVRDCGQGNGVHSFSSRLAMKHRPQLEMWIWEKTTLGKGIPGRGTSVEQRQGVWNCTEHVFITIQSGLEARGHKCGNLCRKVRPNRAWGAWGLFWKSWELLEIAWVGGWHDQTSVFLEDDLKWAGKNGWLGRKETKTGRDLVKLCPITEPIPRIRVYLHQIESKANKIPDTPYLPCSQTKKDLLFIWSIFFWVY